MELRRVEISELKGIDRNAVEGVAQQQPTDLQGLAFGRMGGYRAAGAVSSGSLSPSVNATLIGFDQANLVGLATATESGSLFLFSDAVQSTVAKQGSGSFASSFSFIERVGVHGSPYYNFAAGSASTDENGDYLVVDENNIVYDQSNAPFELSAVMQNGGQLVGGDSYTIYVLRYLNTPSGKYIIGLMEEPSSNSSSNDQRIAISGTLTSSASSNSYFDVYIGETTFDATDKDAYYFDTVAEADWNAYSDTIDDVPVSTILSRDATFINFEGIAVSHRDRVYGRPNKDENSYWVLVGSIASQGYGFFASLPKRSLIYTIPSWANLGHVDNWLTLPAGASDDITGLASSPAGLMIFCDRETFLLRSDPSLSDFQVQRVSSYIGHDSTFPPAVVGGVVFSVFDGDVYAFALGMGDVDFGTGIRKVSQPFSNVVNFTRVASEANNRAIVALGDGGEAYRYSLEYDEWTTEFMNQSSAFNAGSLLVPSTSTSGVMWFSSSPYSSYEMPFGGGTATAASVKWEDVDLGDKRRAKMWRRVRLQMNDGYSGTPTLDYVINNTSGTITASNETGGRFVFTFPRGLVNEKAESLTINLAGVATGDTVEPPVTIEVVDRYERR